MSSTSGDGSCSASAAAAASSNFAPTNPRPSVKSLFTSRKEMIALMAEYGLYGVPKVYWLYCDS